MPRDTAPGLDDIKQFDAMGMLSIPLKAILKRLTAGEKLVLRDSLMEDEGEDYSALLFVSRVEGGREEQVGFWPGY